MVLIQGNVILLVRWVVALKEKCRKLFLPYQLWTRWNYEHVEIFEETVIGGFSCVNTRLAFDTQILLPNLPDKNNLEENPMNKDFNYKGVYNLKINNEKNKKKSYY